MPQPRTAQFDTLVAPHMATLFRVAFGLVRNTHDAQDLVQDTCVAACEHPAEVGEAEHPVRWLLRVLHNRFIDAARRKKLVSLVALDAPEVSTRPTSDSPGPEE